VFLDTVKEQKLYITMIHRTAVVAKLTVTNIATKTEELVGYNVKHLMRETQNTELHI
jgi:hypothetical protein